MPDLRPVGYVIGLLVAALGALMLIPTAFDLAAGNGHWPAFLESAVITAVTGGLVALASANGVGQGLTLQQVFLLTTGVWVVLPLFGALPFVLGEPRAGLTDAFFESMSGMTTTGTTVFVGLDHMPAGTLLWRGILQWLGGLGIVIVAMLFLPVMKVGGMQFFRSEGFDTLGKVLPRALDISAALIQVYLLLTLAAGIGYYLVGMTAFDALVHALTTVATGGFSTRDASFGAFQGAPEYVGAVLMLLSTLPFIRFVQLIQGQAGPLWRDRQVRAYVRWTAIATVLVFASNLAEGRMAGEAALREALFNVTSIFSGTGFTSMDLTRWSTFAFVVLLVVGAIGGCTASTGCSIKVFRYLILFEAIRTQIRRLYSPNLVAPLRFDGRPVEFDVLNSVIALFTLYIVTFGVLSVALGLTGLQTRTAITAAWTAVFNVGPVFGAGVGATGAVDAFPAAAKWLMIFGMLLGRLELVSVLVLFTVRFWRA
jgi:trk system potassium uptake protein TrkH